MAASAEVCQAKLYKNAEVKKEVDATIASYIDVANVLFWDSVFHRSLSRLNSKLTVTEGELQLKALLGFDMIANFNTVGFRVTYNMRVLCTLIVCLLYKWWPILEVETGPSEQPAILGAAATSLQGPPPPPLPQLINTTHMYADAENGFSYLKTIMKVLDDHGNKFWCSFMKEQLVQLLDLLLTPPK